MALLVLLNNFMHDFSAAGWVVGAVVLWSVLREDIPAGDSGRTAVNVLANVSFLMRLAVVGIVVFGIARALAYGDYEWNPAAGERQVTLLIVKHVILAGVFVWGLVHYLRARSFIRQARNEGRE